MRELFFATIAMLLFSLYGRSQSCLPNGITFTTQAEIDSFSINYPGCTSIERSVDIIQTDITNLQGLSVLTYIGGELNIISNPNLTSLNGLENLTADGEDVDIAFNPLLTNLQGLDNLTSITGVLVIDDNPALTSLDGLQNLLAVGDDIEIFNNPLLSSISALENVTSALDYLYVSNNAALTSLSGLGNITSVEKILTIDHNPLLTNLNGLENITSVGGNLSIGFNDALTDFNGFGNLLSVGGNLDIYYNYSLANLDDLGNVASVGGELKLSHLPLLTSLDDLKNIVSVEGDLQLSNLPQITNLSDLGNIDTVGGGLTVDTLALLTSLGGLENITFTGGNLIISGNPLLTSLSSMGNISSVGKIHISGNPSLPACAIPPVCNRLATNPDSVFIGNNAPGCNDAFEVEIQCAGTIVTVAVAYCQDSNWLACGQAIPGELVHFSAPNQSIFRQTSATGTTQFIFLGVSISFSLELPQVPADKWEIGEFVQALNSSTGHDSLSVLLLLKPLIQCPELTVDLGLPSFFRGCLVNSPVQVTVKNTGTAVAEGLKTAVVLPPDLLLLSATPPLETQNGDSLFFDLGDLPPFGTATVQLTVQTDCNAFLIGQTLCLEAFVGLDNACPTTLPAFSEIKLSAKCVGDTLVRFTIKNIGDAPTQNLHEYKIIRNEIAGSAVNFSLNAQQSISVDVPADGATYRMEATKLDDGTLTATALENCGGLTPGLITAFWLDQGPLEYDFDCRQVIGSFDPNGKSAVPTGAGGNHMITANRPLQYTIDFQNTGTDTAFRVLLRDVLPEALDLNTFRPVSASHPNTWEIRGNTLEVLFSPIALPDSNVNEAASHGFFSFEINQKPDLPDGTTFENTANIIFDFNPPIGTNYVQHTIGQLTVRVDEAQPYGNLWALWGNPLRDVATFRTEQFIAGEKRFDLYDAAGRLLRSAQFPGQAFEFQRDGLAAGLYFFKIGDAQGRIFSGKMVVVD